MKRKRIDFCAWGSRQLRYPAYAMRTETTEFDSRAGVVAAAIARKNGLHVITVRPDGTALEKGKPTDHHYQLTLGTPCPGGGWTPEASCWIAIPVGQ